MSAYATFIVNQHLDAFAAAYMDAFTAHGLHPEHYFPFDEHRTVKEQFFEYAYQQLQMIANDRSEEQVAEKLRKFFPVGTGTLEELQQKSNNIYLLAYIRKSVFKRFLPQYTTDVQEILDITGEMDRYSFLFEKTTQETYLHHLTELLAQKEDQLLEAQQLSGTGSLIWDVHESRGQATPELLHILEIGSVDEMRDHSRHIHKDDWKRILEQLITAVRDLSPFELRYRFESSQGERTILAKGKAEGTREHPIVKGTVMDITDMEQMVSRLEQSQALYKEAQSLARMGNWSWNSNTGIVKWSEEVYHICELDPVQQPLSVRRIREMVYEEDWKEIKRQFRRLKEQAEPLVYIGNLRLQSGKEKILEIKGKISLTEDGVVQLIGTVQDVTWEQGLIRTLQEAQRRYRHMESIAHIGNWTIDLEHSDVHVTDEFLAIYGIDPSERPVSVDHIRSFINGESRVILDNLIERCKLYGESYQHQFTITTSTGVHKWLMARGEAILDSEGRICRIAGTAQDITNEQRLLDQLQHSEVLYKQAQTIGRIGNWLMDIGTGEISWSDEVYHIYEIDVADKAFLRMEKALVVPSDRAIMDECIQHCIATGTPFNCQYRIQLPNGTIKYLRSKGELLLQKKLSAPQLVGTVQDITDQVIIEKQLQGQQWFTQKITDIAPSVIAVLDIRTGKYDFLSLAVEKILGYPREDFLGEGVAFAAALVHPEDSVALTEQNRTALDSANNRVDNRQKEAIVEFKYRVKHKNGHYRWMHTFSTVFERDENGQVSHILNVSIDITGEKQAEQILNNKNLLLQQSNSSLEEFAYIASHDLQEPLRKISTFGNMLETLQEEHLSDSGKLYIRKIVDSSIRMQGMINDLLSISIISGNKSFQKESLQALLDEVLETLEYKIEQTKAIIEVPRSLPEMSVIAAQFRQLFQNLISNSLKFAKAGTIPHIKISYAYVTGEDVTGLGFTDGNKYLKIVFEDNGIGFSNNYAGKIFAIFQRLNGKSEYEGTGIGLAICKKIAEHHKGIIYAEGEAGIGALFTIVLPVPE